MLRTVIRHEWRTLRADRTAWIVLAVFALCVGYAVFGGSVVARRQQAAYRSFVRAEEERINLGRERAAQMERYLREGNAVEALPKYQRYEYEYGPLDARWAAAVGQHAVLPPAPLLALAAGESDLRSSVHQVKWYYAAALPVLDQTENPLRLLTGRFDLAFVLLYLYPLFILAFSFDLLASEKQTGTLTMLLAQPVRLRTVVAGKVAARALIIFGVTIFFSPACFLLSGVGTTDGGVGSRLLLWTTATLIYGAFWFGFAVAVNARGGSGGANALALVACWLLFVVLVPLAVNLTAAFLHPVPPRAGYVDAQRTAEAEAEGMSRERLREIFFDTHPEFPRGADYSEWGRTYGAEGVAREEEVTRRLESVRRRFDEPLARQRSLAERVSFLSPAMLTQSALVDIAGTGAARYGRYEAQVEEYRRTWQSYFRPRMFGRAPFAPDDYERIPRYAFGEEPARDLARRVAGPLAGLLALSLALGCRRADRVPALLIQNAVTRSGRGEYITTLDGRGQAGSPARLNRS